jgi:hypothetical protein
MSTTIQPPQIHELVDNHAGIYIPRTFVRSISRDRIRRASHEDLDILEAGPDHEHYWDAWSDVLDTAIIVDDHGREYRLDQTEHGDLNAVPRDWEWIEEDDEWRAPEGPDLVRLELPEEEAIHAPEEHNPDPSAIAHDGLRQRLQKAELVGWRCTRVGRCYTRPEGRFCLCDFVPPSTRTSA